MGTNGFGNMVFTQEGLNLLAKAETGTQLQFTRVAVGDGYLNGQDETKFTALIEQIMSLNILSIVVSGQGAATVGAVLSNASLATGFYWREIGLFAQDPQLGEILFGYDNSTGHEIFVPPASQSSFTAPLNIGVYVSNASNVTAVIDQSLVFATLTQVSTAQAAAEAYTDAKFPVQATGLGAGSATDIVIGARTGDPELANPASTGTFTQLLGWIMGRIKAITGKANWYDAPDITLLSLNAHKSRHATGGADVLAPGDIGAETPTGAQIKATAAQTSAATYTDTKVGAVTVASIGAATASQGAKADTALQTSQLGQAAGVAKQDDLTAHLAETATLTKASHAQLQTTVDTSETKALTPKALYTHSNDMTEHVSSAERTAWASVAARYSEAAQSITTGVSVDTLVNNGLYQGSGLVNAPDIDWYLIEVINHDSAWVYQRAIAFTQSETGSSRTPVYERVMRSGAWTAWTRISSYPKIQTGTTSITVATAGTEVTKAITFPTAYSSAPIVLLSLNTPSALSSGYLILHLGSGSVSTTGFTACANSYAAQTLSGNWVAIGN